MRRKLILVCMCVLIVLISACSNRLYKKERVADVTLEIRFGKLYVTLNNGPTYKTSLEADDISALRPEFGRGTVSTAYILKDAQTVAVFSRSYVDDSKITKEDLENEFGHVTRVLSPLETVFVATGSVIVCIVVAFKLKEFLVARKNRKVYKDSGAAL